MNTSISGDCRIPVAVSCWNITSTAFPYTLTSSSSVPLTSTSPDPNVQLAPTPSKTAAQPPASQPPIETSSTDTPVVSTAATPSPDVSDESTNERTVLSPNVLYVIIGSGVVVVLALAVLLTLVVVCRRCCLGRRKGPVVEDHTNDTSIPGQQNQTYLEMEPSKNAKQLPENELLYDQVKDPAQPDSTGQTYHTLKHSPDISSKRSNGSCSDMPPNEALYETVAKPPTQQQQQQQQQKQVAQKQQQQVAQKPAMYEEPKNGKPFYHTLESGTAAPKYHILESSSHKYHILESSRSKEEPLYSEAGQRRAATFPRLAQVSRGRINQYIVEGQEEEML